MEELPWLMAVPHPSADYKRQDSAAPPPLPPSPPGDVATGSCVKNLGRPSVPFCKASCICCLDEHGFACQDMEMDDCKHGGLA